MGANSAPLPVSSDLHRDSALLNFPNQNFAALQARFKRGSNKKLTPGLRLSLSALSPQSPSRRGSLRAWTVRGGGSRIESTSGADRASSAFQ